MELSGIFVVWRTSDHLTLCFLVEDFHPLNQRHPPWFLMFLCIIQCKNISALRVFVNCWLIERATFLPSWSAHMMMVHAYSMNVVYWHVNYMSVHYVSVRWVNVNKLNFAMKWQCSLRRRLPRGRSHTLIDFSTIAHHLLNWSRILDKVSKAFQFVSIRKKGKFPWLKF